ncbi:hypothetical protein NUU61_007219 [Penicillium alfredii]|uniref:Myb-like domain-containing protein n=1 Tax=Penicillium alfredii TaxID=1506179 RepID=A0A9W9F2G0_9EURO|nr:uncharacterized protein NUU61_007219 [Penicillium alfredii]KAJ5092349.1 hypothetical protein NUU61_007219 [Penicillium alfredii]
MKSFSSSVINKSGKKFAPKAPPRRGGPPPARRPSATQQNQAQAAQASQQEKAPATSFPPPYASPAEPEGPAVAEEGPVAAPDAQKPATPAPSKPTATAIPIPLPKRKASISQPTKSTSQDATFAIAPPTPSAPSLPSAPRPEPQPRPSIEHKPAQSVPEPTSLEATQDSQNVEIPSEGPLPPAPAPEPQPRDTPSAPTPIRPTKRASKVSEKNASSRGKAPALATPPSSQPLVPTIEEPSGIPSASVAPSTPEPSKTAAKTAAKTRKRKVSKAETSEAEGGAENAKRNRRKKREPTPDGAETVEILPNVVKMSELCKDLKTGRKSKRETELQKIDLAEQERKQKAHEEGSNAPPTPVKESKEPESSQQDRLPDVKTQSGPVMRIVNGEIVLDTASLQVDRHADAARSAGDLEDVVESSFTRKVNQASYGKRSKTESWDEDMTDLFYRGLRMFGTDFMVISKMFPGRSRRQIKLKFNNEERRDPQKIKDTLLGPRETIDIATYSEMTNTVYDDPKVIQQELDEEKRVIEEQHSKEKQMQEELLRNPTGATETDGAPEADKTNGGPAKSKSRSKNQTKKAGGGTEQVLGSIDDIPMVA